MLTIHRPRRAKTDEISRTFDDAISASCRAGCLQDAALAARVASTTLSSIKILEKQCRERALELYSSWGHLVL